MNSFHPSVVKLPTPGTVPAVALNVTKGNRTMVPNAKVFPPPNAQEVVPAARDLEGSLQPRIRESVAQSLSWYGYPL